MLTPIPAASLGGLRQLANKMEKILLVALEGYGNTFVEPKVELGARFGHLVRTYILRLSTTGLSPTICLSTVPGYLPGDTGTDDRAHKPEASRRDAALLE